HEYEEIATLITSNCDKNANIIIGTAIDNALNNEIHVTVIATGFNERKAEKPKSDSVFNKLMEEGGKSLESSVTDSSEDSAVADFNSRKQKKHSPVLYDESDLDIPAFLRKRAE
ncbi:MAG: cell division protein FtsZ, partial [Spirochaetota bacterium]|nr:cell division protein FtsZ [Spirochaetota bacterium]